jgi:hypothetical protein
MSRPKLEVADIFRRHGAAWRTANKAHLSLRGGSFDDLVGAAGECKRQGDADGFCDDLHAQSCLEIPLGFARAKASLATQMRTAPCGPSSI